MTMLSAPWPRVLAALLGLSLLAAAEAPAREEPASAQSLLERAFANLYGFSSSQKISLRARHADGKEFVRTARMLRRGNDLGLNRMLVKFVGPPDMRGVGVLLEERPDHSYDAFLYQPIYDMVRRISVAQRRDAFFGTDVFFEDLEAKDPAQWSARLLRTETFAGSETSVVELRPAGFPSGYDRILAWFDHARPIMVRTEFYREGERVKVLEIDPQKILEVDGYLIPLSLVFRGSRGSVTTLEISEVELRSEIPDESFSRSQLEFGSERSGIWKSQ